MTSGGTVAPTTLEQALQVIANLESSLQSRALIACAQGILMQRYGLEPDAAMCLLRRVSMDRHVKVRLLAQAIVAGDCDLLAVQGRWTPSEPPRRSLG